MKKLWTGSLLASALTHALCVAVCAYLGKNDFFFTPPVNENAEMRVLLDLRSLPEDELKEYSHIISPKNIKSAGQITRDKGLHVPDGTEKNYQNFHLDAGVPKPGPRATEKEQKADEELRTDEKSGVKIPSRTRTAQNPVSSMEKEGDSPHEKTRLMTEQSMMFRLYTDLSGRPRPGAQKDIEAEFYQAFVDSVGEAFRTFVYANPEINFHFVNPDSASVLSGVSRDGKIVFLKKVQISKTQDFFNYLAEKSIEHAKSLTYVPPWIVPEGEEMLLIQVAIAYRGPNTGWWLELLPVRKP